MNSGYVHWCANDGPGHQSAYDDVLISLVKSLGGIVGNDPSATYAARFHPTLDFNYPELIRSIVMSAFGRTRTVALLLRPQVCVRPAKPGHYVKAIFFRLLKRISTIEILTIVPFDLEPGLAHFADGWIYDPQLWDLPLLMPGLIEQPDDPLHKSEKPVISLLGTLDRNKGFARFAALWCADSGIRSQFRFIAAGKVAVDCADVAKAFVEAGGTLIDERISDDAMMALYRQSFAVWCAYDTGYDQASGIFGRAFQLGVPAIVTAGSFISRQAAALGHAVLELPGENRALEAAGSALCGWNPDRLSLAARRASIDAMRDHSTRVIDGALFGSAR